MLIRAGAVLLSLVAVWGAADLSWSQWRRPGACPDLLGLAPACYVILVLAVTALVGASTRRRSIYLASCVVAILIALPASLGQLLGWVTCPQTGSGIPKCYLSLGLFAAMLLLGTPAKGHSRSSETGGA